MHCKINLKNFFETVFFFTFAVEQQHFAEISHQLSCLPGSKSWFSWANFSFELRTKTKMEIHIKNIASEPFQSFENNKIIYYYWYQQLITSPVVIFSCFLLNMEWVLTLLSWRVRGGNSWCFFYSLSIWTITRNSENNKSVKDWVKWN